MNRVTFRHDCCWKPHESSIVFPIVLLANWTAYSRRSKTLTAILLILATSIVPVFSQVVPPRLEKAGTVAHLGDESHKGVAGYLHGAEPDYRLLLPPYPALDSERDQNDVATFQRMQVPDSSARWKLAVADEQMRYSRFSEVMGVDLDATKFPIAIHLLDRMERDAMDTTFDAKSFFNRPRPFQRFALTHVCGADTAPQPELHPQGGSSYPSGHATFGWTLALALAEIAPDRAQAIMSRGREYGESRVICGVHFPSDVVAGEIVATAIVERLHTVSEFTHDLACAQQEFRRATLPGSPMSRECKGLEESFARAERAENEAY